MSKAVRFTIEDKDAKAYRRLLSKKTEETHKKIYLFGLYEKLKRAKEGQSE